MSNLPQITSLLTQLASHLQSPDPQNPIPHLISTLNHSLNLNQTQPRVRVLDKALSLMCFKAPQVFECEIQCLVDTILSVLWSSVSCRVLGSGKEELLRVGSLISGGNCEKLMEVIVGICAKLEQYDTHKQKLLSSIIRVAVSASCYQSYIPLAPILCLEPRYEKRNCISELRNLLHEEGSFNNNEIPLRLLLWDLDPLTLKHDISNVLHELVERPFINLRKELHDRITWRTITICLVLSPDKFIETRTLLHSWFLKTGMSSILELQNKLVSSTLEVLARPMQWSISMDVGLKLPFSSAYFPNDHHFVVTLTGPISDESLLGLVHHITEKHSHPILKDSSAWTKRIDHKSTWATLMAFHEWFLFASVLLFFKKESCPNFSARCVTCGAKEYCAAAARFLAFCINPTCEANLNLLVGYLVQISESWILKQSNSHMQSTKSGHNKSFRKPRVRGTEKDSMTSKEITSRALSLWLTDFHDYHMKYWTGAKMQHSYTLQWKSLFQKVPLGIFVGCSDLDEVGCELLLHYAATGEILQTTETQSVQLEHVVHEPKWAEDAVAGVNLVFDVCETVEDMSLSMFETEESRIEFVCQLKLRSAEFMVKCIRKLLQVTFDEKSLVDLHGRLEEWSQGGIAQSSKALKDVLTDLAYRLHSP